MAESGESGTHRVARRFSAPTLLLVRRLCDHAMTGGANCRNPHRSELSRAVHAVDDPDPDDSPGRPETRPESPVAQHALNAMTRAVTSLRNQVARLISTAPPLDQPAEEVLLGSDVKAVSPKLNL